MLEQGKDKAKNKKSRNEISELREGESYIEITNVYHAKVGQKKKQADKFAKFAKIIEQKLVIGADIQFPIPAFIQAVTAAHLDKLTPEQSLAMKTAAVICKGQGNSSVIFDEHMVRGTHPVPEQGFSDERRLRFTLKQLCEMKYINVLYNHSSLSPRSVSNYNASSSYGSNNNSLVFCFCFLILCF